MLALTYQKLMRFLLQDEDQKEFVRELATKRKGSFKTYMRRGIFCSADEELEELGYILEQMGLDETALGVDDATLILFKRGYILPVWDGYNNLLFFINYSWLRDKSKKYLNIYPVENQKNIKAMKMYGMHNLKQALQEDRIFVVEGAFDVLRLEEYGLPAVCLLGTKVMPYHKQFLSRFSTVIYIQDEDGAGEGAWSKFKREIPHALAYRMSGVYKDVDEYAEKSKLEFEEWLHPLLTLGKRTA